jgi:hypothetical protein
LDEERQESNRKEVELKSLSLLLKEKERVIQDGAAILAEVQRSADGLRER